MDRLDQTRALIVNIRSVRNDAAKKAAGAASMAQVQAGVLSGLGAGTTA